MSESISQPVAIPRASLSTCPPYEIQKLCPIRMTESNEMGETSLETVIALLDDEHIRSVLTVTSDEPKSASELADHCDISPSSVYRRLDRLREADLIDEQTRPRSDGHHDTVYVSRLDRFELSIDSGELQWNIDRSSDDVADQLTRLWGKF